MFTFLYITQPANVGLQSHPPPQTPLGDAHSGAPGLLQMGATLPSSRLWFPGPPTEAPASGTCPLASLKKHLGLHGLHCCPQASGSPAQRRPVPQSYPRTEGAILPLFLGLVWPVLRKMKGKCFKSQVLTNKEVSSAANCFLRSMASATAAQEGHSLPPATRTPHCPHTCRP